MNRRSLAEQGHDSWFVLCLFGYHLIIYSKLLPRSTVHSPPLHCFCWGVLSHFIPGVLADVLSSMVDAGPLNCYPGFLPKRQELRDP